MIKAICLLILLIDTLSLKLRINTQIQLQDQYQLHVQDSSGDVVYSSSSLPLGIQIKNDKLMIASPSLARNGVFTARINAIDSNGNTDSKIILLIVHVKSKIISSPIEAQLSVMEDQTINQESEKKQHLIEEGIAETETSSQSQIQDESKKQNNSASSSKAANIPLSVQLGERVAEENQKPAQSQKQRSGEIFERQINASKNIANLLAAIKSATANKNAVLAEADTRSLIFQKATEAKRKADEQIQQAQNNEKAINEGLDKTMKLITNHMHQIDGLQIQKMKKISEKNALVLASSRERRSLNNLVNEIHNKKAQLDEIKKTIEEKERMVQNLQSEQDHLENQKIQGKIKQSKLEQDTQKAKSKIVLTQQRIQILKRQLQLAQQQLKKQRKDVVNFETKKLYAKNAVDKIERRLDQIRGDLLRYKVECKRLNDNFDALEQKIYEDLMNRKAKIQKQVQNLNQQVKKHTEQIDQIEDEIDRFRGNFDKLKKTLKALRQKLIVFQRQQQQARNNAERFNSKALAAKKSLDAIKERYLQEAQIINRKTDELENARRQKLIADEAVENHLREDVDVAPFSIVPDGDGLTEIGAGKYAIISWEDYVLATFGSGIRSFYPENLNILYQLYPTEQNNAECQPQSLVALSGFIQNVLTENSYVLITDEGKRYKIEISECGMVLSNKQNHTITPGDIVVLKGYQGTIKNEILVLHLTALNK